MPARLWIIYGSHPCATVEAALKLKGVDYSTVELPPLTHVPVMKALFGDRTVPGITFEDGEKVQGSRRILERLDERVPEPALLPGDPDARARVLEAERWGDEVLQPAVRRVLWPTLKANPSAAPSFNEGAKLPLPAPVLKRSIGLIARGEMKLNRTSEAVRAQDLGDLPRHLDRIDGWIADGTLGGASPNRADLQIGSSLALLMTMEDLRAQIAGRPAARLAQLFPDTKGSVPAGALTV